MGVYGGYRGCMEAIEVYGGCMGTIGAMGAIETKELWGYMGV